EHSLAVVPACSHGNEWVATWLNNLAEEFMSLFQHLDPGIKAFLLNSFFTVMGSLLTVLFVWARDYIRSRSGEYTGTWLQTIPATNSEPEKIAVVTCRHVGDRIVATTLRTKPKLKYEQKWKVELRVKRGLVFGTYWPIDASKLPGSYGTLQFKV